MKGGRRSLLKGAMAAPFVLTVGPGAARAQASSIMCLKRDAARAVEQRPPSVMQVDADDWMRVNLDLVQLRVWQGSTPKPIPGKHFLGVDRFTYWRLDKAQFGAPAAAPTTYTTGNCTATQLGERLFALVYVDPKGQQDGLCLRDERWQRRDRLLLDVGSRPPLAAPGGGGFGGVHRPRCASSALAAPKPGRAENRPLRGRRGGVQPGVLADPSPERLRRARTRGIARGPQAGRRNRLCGGRRSVRYGSCARRRGMIEALLAELEALGLVEKGL